jgi:hypothetical protein
MMVGDLPLLLTVRAAAAYSGVTVAQAYELVRGGEWGRVVRLSRRQLVSRANVMAWVVRMTSEDESIDAEAR